MRRILIFGGTSEGRELAERCVKDGIYVTVSVATVTGTEELERSEYLEILEGRKDIEEIRELAANEEYAAIVDATHPFAKDVTKNIKDAVSGIDKPCFRLKRDTGACVDNISLRYFKSARDCAAALEMTDGNIMLTTGSKEIADFAAVLDKDRLYVRVLPAIESIEKIKASGIANEHIVAMQGVFSKELNIALMKEFAINILVTKETGKRGGYQEKLDAASDIGVEVYVIENPEKESGLSIDEVFYKIQKIIGSKNDERKEVSLIGMGMGRLSMLSKEQTEALEKADIYVGSGRLLNLLDNKKKKYKEYNAEKIVEIIKQEEAKRIAVVFSGDTGFFSGAKGLKLLLKDADKIDVKVFPGISSISYLSSRTGLDWQDAHIVSVHGRDADVTGSVREHEKVFLLLSDAKELKEIAFDLSEAGLGDTRIITGISLSSDDERIIDKEAVEYEGLELRGISCAFLINPHFSARIITPGRSDRAFVRGEVPMTKEEVRSLSLCKLKLTADAVVWDIGAGTGSVSVECALLSERIRVCSIERKEEACSLIRENVLKSGLANVEIIEGEAPGCLENLMTPSHVFIGGSGGHIREILESISGFNKKIRVVINAVTLETVSEITEAIKDISVTDEDIVLASFSKGEKRGRYHLMQAGNPVYIFSFTINQGD